MEITERLEPDEIVTVAEGPLGHCPVCDAWFSIVPDGHFDQPAQAHCSPALED